MKQGLVKTSIHSNTLFHSDQFPQGRLTVCWMIRNFNAISICFVLFSVLFFGPEFVFPSILTGGIFTSAETKSESSRISNQE